MSKGKKDEIKKSHSSGIMPHCLSPLLVLAIKILLGEVVCVYSNSHLGKAIKFFAGSKSEEKVT